MKLVDTTLNADATTTSFTQPSVTTTLVQANSITNSITLNNINSLRIGDTLISSKTTDISGILPSTKYKIKSGGTT